MFYPKKFLLRHCLIEFFLNPVFLFLLGLVYFICYQIYFDTVLLCDYDDETFNQLKRSLSQEVNNYKDACKWYEY